MPAIMVSKPAIDVIIPNKAVTGIQYNEDNSIKIIGYGLENVHAVFINDVFEGEAVIISKTNEEIILQIPQKYYNLTQSLYIKLEARITSDLFCYSNTAVMEVLPEDAIPQPQIDRVEPERLCFTGEAAQNITLYGSGYNMDSKIVINNNIYNTEFDEEKGSLTAEVPFYDWCKEEWLELYVVQEYNGYQSNKKSNTYTIATEYKDKELSALNNVWFQNNQCILKISDNFAENSKNQVEDIIMQNYLQGQRIFEIKLAFSRDGILYSSLKDMRGFANNLPNTYEQIRAVQKREGTLVACSFQMVCDLLSQYNDMYVSLDIIDSNNASVISKMYRYIVEEARKVDESILDNFVVQVDSEEMYRLITAIYPFSSIMFNLDKAVFNGEIDRVLQFVEDTGIRAVKISINLLSEKLVQKLREKGCYIYASDVENISNIGIFLENGVYGMVFNKPPQAGQKKEIEKFAVKSKIIAIEDLQKYFEEVKKTDYLCICSIKDDAAIGLSEAMFYAICGLGAKKYPTSDIRSSYILISRKGKALAEESSNDSIVKCGGGVITDESNVDVISAGLEVGNYSSIVIDGIEYSMNERGINVVLYDTNEKKVIDSLNFDIYEGAKISRKLLPIDTLIYENVIYDGYELLLDYLSKIDSERYVTMISVADDASSNMTEEVQDALFKLGLKETLIDAFRESYIAVINGEKVVFEEKGDQVLVFSTEIDGLKIQIESAGGVTDAHANIKIDGIDYAQNVRGINMVVYDKFLGIVCDSICFDLYNGYDVKMKQ